MTLRFHVGSQDMQGKVHCLVMIVATGYLITITLEELLYLNSHQQKKQPASCCVLHALCVGRCRSIQRKLQFWVRTSGLFSSRPTRCSPTQFPWQPCPQRNTSSPCIFQCIPSHATPFPTPCDRKTSSSQSVLVRHTRRLSLLLANKDLQLPYLWILSSKRQANTPLPHQRWDSATPTDAAVVASPHQRHGYWSPPCNPVYVAAVCPTGSRSQVI